MVISILKKMPHAKDKINNRSNDNNNNNAMNRLMVIQSHLSPGSIDLARERENPGFNVQKMMWLFNKGKENFEALVSFIIYTFYN